MILTNFLVLPYYPFIVAFFLKFRIAYSSYPCSFFIKSILYVPQLFKISKSLDLAPASGI